MIRCSDCDIIFEVERELGSFPVSYCPFCGQESIEEIEIDDEV